MDTNLSSDAGIMASEELASEGIISDEVEADEELVASEEEHEEEIPQVPVENKNKKGDKFKEILSEKNTAIARAEKAEQENAILNLKLKYWEFDEVQVLELKKLHPTLSDDDVYTLRDSKKPKEVEQPNWSESMVWHESRKTEVRTITNAELKQMEQSDYNIATDRIKRGELILQG